MIIDSSAIVAILLDEPEADQFMSVIAGSDNCVMSAVNLFEASMVIGSRLGDDGDERLDRLIKQLKINIVEFTPMQAQIARRAFHTYGKGRHSASLNFGDCMAYALAKNFDEPLLFKGNDFSKTDIVAAA